MIYTIALAMTIIVVLLAGCASPAGIGEQDRSAYPPRVGAPSLEVKASWPEQQIDSDYIHKMRVPRGGTIDITATIDPAGAKIRPATVTVDAGGLVPINVVLDGKTITPPSASVAVDLSQKRQVRWTFQIPWELRAAQRDYRFDVAVVPSVRTWDEFVSGVRRPSPVSTSGAAANAAAKVASVNENLRHLDGTLKASVTVEGGVSCYDTTLKNRLDMLAKSPYCKLVTIGKTVLGRDMYLLRVTDWSVPAKDKKQFIIIGPQHGDEPSGVEAAIDFAWELVSKPENKDYLRHFTVCIVPAHNPDGHEISSNQNRHGIDVGNHGWDKLIEPETIAVHDMLLKYAPEFTDAMCLVHHQWGRDYTLLSYLDNKPAAQSASWRVLQNIAISVTNDTDNPMYPSFSEQVAPYTGVRGFLIQKLGIPNFSLEDRGHSLQNLADQMPNIVNAMAIEYASLDQMRNTQPLKPKVHPPVKANLPADRMLQAYKTDKPPTIDGKLDEACWSNAVAVTSPVRPGVPGSTTILACYDDNNLYLAFKAPDWVKTPTSGPSVSKDISDHDGCEIMLDTNFNRWSYYRLDADTAAAFSVIYFLSPGFVDPQPCRTDGIKVAASLDGGAIEMCIPFAALNHAPELDGPVASGPVDGAIWGVNFIRHAHADKPDESWSKLSGYSSHRPWEFNAIIFHDNLSKTQP